MVQQNNPNKKKMRKKLSSILIDVALWLYEGNRDKLAPKVDGYIAGKIGVGYEFSSYEVKKYQEENGVSYKKAVSMYVSEYKKRVKVAIAKKVGDIVEFDVYKPKRGKTVVSGHIKVYEKGCK